MDADSRLIGQCTIDDDRSNVNYGAFPHGPIRVHFPLEEAASLDHASVVPNGFGNGYLAPCCAGNAVPCDVAACVLAWSIGCGMENSIGD
ncbi:hypothetical protein TNCV_1033611 [Trichonephila clavipes]|nr:hypothetical protein TNCV_1033611 [Trichonephila clavipes]